MSICPLCFIYTNLFTFRYQYSTIYINNVSEFRTDRSIQWGYYMEKFDKRCPYCGKMMERGEIPRGGGDSPHDIKWIPEHKKVNGMRSYYIYFLRKMKIK